MPLNISHAEGAYLSAKDRINQFMQKFDYEWHEPVRKALMGALMASMPPEVKAQLKAMSPEALERLEQEYTNASKATPGR